MANTSGPVAHNAPADLAQFKPLIAPYYTAWPLGKDDVAPLYDMTDNNPLFWDIAALPYGNRGRDAFSRGVQESFFDADAGWEVAGARSIARPSVPRLSISKDACGKILRSCR